MTENEIILDPVDHITTDAIGAPGKRVFYLQAWKGDRIVSLLIEKFQLQSMAIGVEQFMKEIAERFPQLSIVPPDYDEKKMHIQPPVDPIFRIGELGLSYDVDRDLVLVVAREMLSGEMQPDDARVAKLYCSRSQIQAMTSWGLQVAERGRPICPYCGEPEDPEGHICPKKNGRNN